MPVVTFVMMSRMVPPMGRGESRCQQEASDGRNGQQGGQTRCFHRMISSPNRRQRCLPSWRSSYRCLAEWPLNQRRWGQPHPARTPTGHDDVTKPPRPPRPAASTRLFGGNRLDVHKERKALNAPAKLVARPRQDQLVANATSGCFLLQCSRRPRGLSEVTSGREPTLTLVTPGARTRPNADIHGAAAGSSG